jgi:signal transduction histidine kinase
VAAQWRRFPLDAPVPAADAARTGRPVYLGSRAERAARYPNLVAAQDEIGDGALAAVPMAAGGSVLGVVGLNFRGDRRFGEDERGLLGTLAQLCAQALDRARLYDEARAAIGARDEFLSIAAHELRTPLTILRGHAQLLLRQEAGGRLGAPQARRAASAVVQATTRLAALVDDLLDVARLRSGRIGLRLEPVDLGSLVASAAEEHRVHAGADHAIDVALPPAPCVVVGDPLRLRQVLDNLLDNAVKYSPGGGRVRVALDATGGGVHLRVRDEGIGVPRGAAESVFAPFGRAANAERLALPGMGLGLHIGRQLVEHHGGRLWLESAGEGAGTTVHVVLPAAPAPDDDRRASREPSPVRAPGPPGEPRQG